MSILDPVAFASESAMPLFRQEHDDYRAACRAFVEREITPNVPAWEEAEDYPRELVAKVGAAGFFGAKFAPEWGGSGPDHLAEAVWTEELARAGSGGLGADLGAHASLAAYYVETHGTDAQKERWLRPSISGDAIGALGITEPGAGSDVNGITTRAVRDGDSWVINGAKTFITNGSWCDYVVVAAKTDVDAGHGGITLFIVDRDTPGFSSTRMKMLGWRTSHTGDLAFDDVRVPDSHRLGDEGRGFYAIMTNFAWERLMLSLGAVAASDIALEVAIDYAKQRHAFGRPISSFQVWRHRFADMKAKIEVGRALTHQALRLHVAKQEGDDVDDQELLRIVSMAKLFTQRMAFDIADECVQVHGGAGYLMEYPAQRLWRDARLGPIGGGTDDIMREIIATTYGL